jgi:hypothetical protein
VQTLIAHRFLMAVWAIVLAMIAMVLRTAAPTTSTVPPPVPAVERVTPERICSTTTACNDTPVAPLRLAILGDSASEHVPGGIARAGLTVTTSIWVAHQCPMVGPSGWKVSGSSLDEIGEPEKTGHRCSQWMTGFYDLLAGRPDVLVVLVASNTFDLSYGGKCSGTVAAACMASLVGAEMDAIELAAGAIPVWFTAWPAYTFGNEGGPDLRTQEAMRRLCAARRHCLDVVAFDVGLPDRATARPDGQHYSTAGWGEGDVVARLGRWIVGEVTHAAS